MKRTERGITLIALIITIAVMLILAGVSLQIILQSGLLNTTGNAVGKLDNEWQNETEISEGKVKIDNTIYNSAGEYIENLNLKGTTIIAGQKAEQTIEYKDEKNKTAIIPGGFTVSGVPEESTIDGGLVIYLIDNEDEEVNWNDGAKVAELQTKYDQFVWIPVNNINDMYICQAKTGSNGECNIAINGEGKAECQTHKTENPEKATQMAGRLYATQTGEYFNSNLANQKYTQNTGLREPDVLMDATYADGNSENLTSLTNILETQYNTTNFKKILQDEYNEIVKSVYLNKGFYIGRYETSGMKNDDTNAKNATIKVVAGTTEGINNITWYRMYAQSKKYVACNSLTTVKSTMIQGAAYDQVMKFVDTKNYKVKTQGYALHNRDSSDGPWKTGGLDYEDKTRYQDVTKNIYDLEGNVRVWTTEANSSNSRISRGGYYYYSYSASNRNSGVPYYTSNIIGTLILLYAE